MLFRNSRAFCIPDVLYCAYVYVCVFAHGVCMQTHVRAYVCVFLAGVAIAQFRSHCSADSVTTSPISHQIPVSSVFVPLQKAFRQVSCTGGQWVLVFKFL